jgi:hypothetical protein
MLPQSTPHMNGVCFEKSFDVDFIAQEKLNTVILRLV